MTANEALLRRYREARYLLQSHIDQIDGGSIIHVLPAAILVRSLVYEGGQGSSVMKQLGVKDTIGWYSYPSLPTQNLIAGITLVTFGWPTGHLSYVPYTRDQVPPSRSDPEPTTFDAWWDGVVLAGGGTQTTRKHIVLALANNDGGGHVDLDGRLITAVKAHLPIHWVEDEHGNGVNMSDFEENYRIPIFAIMRSILEELTMTFENAEIEPS